MNTKSFKILATLFTITIFTGIASATVSNLQVQGDPVNNTGTIYASGSTDGDDEFYFNVSQGDGNDWTFSFLKNGSEDNKADSGSEFNFTVNLSDSGGISFSDGPVNLSIAESVTGQTYGGLTGTPDDSVNFTQDSNLASKPAISNTEPVEGGAINVTFGDENSGDYAEIVSYNVQRSTSSGSGYENIGEVKDTNATNYEFKDDGSLTSGTQYYYRVQPVDSAGNKGTPSDFKSSTSDAEGPTVTGKTPTPDTYTNNRSVEVSFDISDPNNVDPDSILVNVTDTDPEEEVKNAGTGKSYVDLSSGTVTVDITSENFDYNPGAVDVNVSVKDDLGNLRTDSWTFTVDKQEPQSISVYNPSDAEQVISQDIITGNYTEDNEINLVEVQIKNSAGEYWTGSQFSSSSNWVEATDSQVWSYDSSAITSQDTYTVDVRATDKAGNTGTISEPITYTIDTGAPDLKTAYINDTDIDGASDEIIVNFTEAIDNSNSNLNEAFRVDKGNLGVVGPGGETDNSQVRVQISGIDTGVRPNLTMLNGTVKDAAGNNLSVNSSTIVEDKARPVLMNARIDSENSSAGTTVVRMDFSENISDPVDELSLGVEGVLSINDNYSDILTADYQLSGSPGVLQTGNSPNITGLGSVEDAAGNPAVLESNQNITVSTFRKEFVNGWNFFSVPIADTSTAEISKIFTQSQLNSIDTIWRYRRGNWSSYTENKGDDSDFTALRGGEGYLVKTSSGFTITPNVNNKVATKGIGSFDMDSGWNLVGHFQEFDQPADNTESGAFDSLGYDFSLAGQDETGEVAAAAVPAEAEVGSAYWINPFTELNPQSDYVENRESQ